MSLKSIFKYVFISLLLGLFTTDLFNNKYIGFAIILIPISSIFLKIYRSSEDKFDFLLFIFILSHFTQYGANRGGLWVTLIFVVFILKFREIFVRFLHLSIALRILILILLLYDILGLIIVNEKDVIIRIQYFFMFSTLLLVFTFASTVPLSEGHLIKLFKVCFIIQIFSFLIALNQKYLLLPIPNTALFPLRVDLFGEFQTSRSSSMIDDYELFAEYSLLSFIIFFPQILFRRKNVSLKNYQLIIFCVLCVINIFLSGTRSSVILIVIAFIVFGLISLIFKRGSKAFFKLSSILILIIIIFVFLGSYIGLNIVSDRFADVNIFDLQFRDISEGGGINRGDIFRIALSRLNNQSWQIGYGFGTPESNLLAWFGSSNYIYADYHNMYLTLPILFGWGGAVSFVLIIFTILLKLINTMKNLKFIKNSYISNMLIGLVVCWASFLINEYKINIWRNLHYVMLILIWLGISYSLASNAKKLKET